MSKKLLGTRIVGDHEYLAGTVMTDEEAQATGLPAEDFTEVTPEPEAPAAEPTPTAEADADAEIDAQAPVEQKNDGEQSASTGSEAGEQGDAPAVETEGADTVAPEGETVTAPEATA